MIPSDRRKEILELLKQYNYVSVSDISKRLFISEPTVRRDLNVLAKEGAIRRTFGGASFTSETSYIWPFDLRSQVNLQEKTYIGKLASKLLKDGDHIFVDSGSTTFCFINELNPSLKLTIMTNCIPIAQSLSQSTNKTIEISGGFFDSVDMCLYGEETTCFINKRWADYFFLSTGGFSASQGFIGMDVQSIPVKHAFSNHAAKTVLLMDHSKLNKPGYYTVFDWSEIDILITDAEPPVEIKQCAQANNITIIY